MVTMIKDNFLTYIFRDRLKFTSETDDRINFLDVTTILEGGKIIFDWFQKLTCLGRYLNFHLRHAFSHKRWVII